MKNLIFLTGESADEADADALCVVTGGVSTLLGPAATLVHVAISTNNKVIADVRPSVDVHVLILVGLNHGDAGRLRAAGGAGTMVDHHVGHRGAQGSGAGGCAGTPLRAGDDSRAS